MANTGRTNAKFITFLLDNSGGVLTDVTAYTKSVGTFGLKFASQDVTAYSDGILNVTIGRPDAPLQIVFQNDTVIYAQLILIALVRTTPLSLDIRVGIQHAWVTGEPTFGISSSATSGYLLKDMTMTDTEITITLVVAGTVAPDFATTAHV